MQKHFSSHNWSLSINLHGGRIEELSYKNELILGTFDRIDGKKGSTHLCVPNFSGEGMEEYGLPFHGPARNSDWSLVVSRRQPSDDNIICKIECNIKKTEKYPANLLVSQEFELQQKSFNHTITIYQFGTDKKSVSVNIGVHNYWATPRGWKGLLINGENVEEKVNTNGFVQLKDQNLVEFPDRKIRWEINGFVEGVLWAAQKEGNFDSSYVCIEPVQNFSNSPFTIKETNLNSGGVISVTQKIYPPTIQQ